MSFDINYIFIALPALIRGLVVTLELSSISIVLSIFLGMAGASIKEYKIPILSLIISWYVEFIRNTPLLAQMFFIYFGLPNIGIKLSLFNSGILTLTLWATAYQIENIRGGLISVKSGLEEASQALGMSRWLYIRYIALPIAMRVSQPSVLNTCISLLKNSAFLQVFGVADITYVAMNRIATDFRTLEMLVTLGIVYLSLVAIMSFISNRLEYRLNKSFRN